MQQWLERDIDGAGHSQSESNLGSGGDVNHHYRNELWGDARNQHGYLQRNIGRNSERLEHG